MIIYGWGESFKPTVYLGIEHCDACDRHSHFWIWEESNYASAYFVPLLRWNRKYLMVCSACESRRMLSLEEKEQFSEAVRGIPEFERCDEIWRKIEISVVSAMNDQWSREQNAAVSVNALINAARILQGEFSRGEILYVTDRLAAAMNGHADSPLWERNRARRQPQTDREQLKPSVQQPQKQDREPPRQSQSPSVPPKTQAATTAAQISVNKNEDHSSAAVIVGMVGAGVFLLAFVMAAVTASNQSQLESRQQSIPESDQWSSRPPKELLPEETDEIAGRWSTGTGTVFTLKSQGGGVRITVSDSNVLEPGSGGLLGREGSKLSGEIVLSYKGQPHVRRSQFTARIASGDRILVNEKFSDELNGQVIANSSSSLMLVRQ